MSQILIPIAGWYADPSDAGQVRWWDGEGWTDHTAAKPEAPARDPRLSALPAPTEAPVADAPPPPMAEDRPRVVSDGPADPPPVVTVTEPAAPAEPPAADVPAPRRRRRWPWIAVLLVLIAAAGTAAWYFLIRPAPATTSAPAAASSPSASAPVAAACTDVVSALTGDGTASSLATQLQTAAAGGDLAAGAQFLAAIGGQSTQLLTASGAACQTAVTNGQAPAEYGTFVTAFSTALDAGAVIPVGQTQPGGLTQPQKDSLSAAASGLLAATAGVSAATPVAPIATPAG